MWKLAIVLILGIFQVACGSGSRVNIGSGNNSSASSIEKLTPQSFLNRKITLEYTQVLPTGGTWISSTDKTTLHFGGTQFTVRAEDGLTLPTVYGYRFTSNESRVWITSINGQDVYNFELKFNTQNSGTFNETYTDFGGTLAFYREGNFILNEETFGFLPPSIINTNFHLDFETATSSLSEEESPVVGERLEIKFHKDSQSIFEQSNLFPLQTEGDYSVKTVDESTLEIQGKYLNTGHQYKLIAHFDNLTSGSFTFSINDDEATASGKFNTIKFTPIEKFELQGNFVGRSIIKSINTNIEYPYNVYLPPNYNTSEKTYPVIYVTDGQWYSDFAYLLESKAKDVIMVSIEQGPRDRRMIDYLPEGHVAYTKFLKEEFIPLIENSYRTNGDRTFTGVSAGGLLGAYLLSVEPVGDPYFKNYILIDGAMWAITNNIINQEVLRFQSSKSLAVNAHLAGSPQGNGWSVKLFQERYENRIYDNLTIFYEEFRVSHDEMGPLAFDSLIDKL